MHLDPSKVSPSKFNISGQNFVSNRPILFLDRSNFVFQIGLFFFSTGPILFSKRPQILFE